VFWSSIPFARNSASSASASASRPCRNRAHTVDRKAQLTADTIRKKLIDLPAELRRTISFDNGTEFAEHHQLHAPLQVETFFCNPHSPWQKGGVENAIGRLRRTLPRKTNLDTIDSAFISQSVTRLNQTRR